MATLVCTRPPGWLGADTRDAFTDMRDWARRAEELGFDGLFVGDRMLSRASTTGGVVYASSMLEATTTLAALAASTERMLLGPLVMVFPYRHPLQLAKVVATLDVISGGRIVLGAGVGWNPPEFAALGIPSRGRGERFEQQLALVRRLWTGEPVTHDGPTWSFSDARITPTPVRDGGPPVWLASFSPGSPLDWSQDVPATAWPVLERVGRLADGWVPLVYSASGRRRLEARVLARAWERVLGSAVDAGRTRADIDFVFSDWCYVLDGPGSERRCRDALSGFFAGSWDEALRTYTIGTADEVVEKVREHCAGIDRVDAYVLTPLSGEADQLDALAEGVVPALRRQP